MGGVANPGAPTVGGRCSVRPPFEAPEIDPIFLEAPSLITAVDNGAGGGFASWTLPAVVPIGIRIRIVQGETVLEDAVRPAATASWTATYGNGIYQWEVTNEGNGGSYISSDPIEFDTSVESGGGGSPPVVVPWVGVDQDPYTLDVTVNWTAASGAIGYHLDVDNAGYTDVGNVTTYPLTLTPGDHTITVRGYNSYGNGAPQGISEYRRLPAPDLTLSQITDTFTLRAELSSSYGSNFRVQLNAETPADNQPSPVDFDRTGHHNELHTVTASIMDGADLDGHGFERSDSLTIVGIPMEPPSVASYGGYTDNFNVTTNPTTEGVYYGGYQIRIVDAGMGEHIQVIDPNIPQWDTNFSSLAEGPASIFVKNLGNGGSRSDSSEVETVVGYISNPSPGGGGGPTTLDAPTDPGLDTSGNYWWTAPGVVPNGYMVEVFENGMNLGSFFSSGDSGNLSAFGVSLTPGSTYYFNVFTQGDGGSSYNNSSSVTSNSVSI